MNKNSRPAHVQSGPNFNYIILSINLSSEKMHKNKKIFLLKFVYFDDAKFLLKNSLIFVHFAILLFWLNVI